ncbi:DNA polymerase II-like protein [Leptotrombidium deliense]|uniref:DNA-directed DNA polymerase n=1 Tax=Leptotrombidium deliense TaxID=299467 RepID=A0A443SQC3_9ACAR|nr:DNA polymerase II-like protein [Leptotrombidium deliense]
MSQVIDTSWSKLVIAYYQLSFIVDEKTLPSQSFTMLNNEEKYFSNDDKWKRTENNENEQLNENVCVLGGHVYDPTTGIHDNVVEFDFASFYPSLIVNYNFGHETTFCVKTQCARKYFVDSNSNKNFIVINANGDLAKNDGVRKNKVTLLSYNYQNSSLCKILKRLLKYRKQQLNSKTMKKTNEIRNTCDAAIKIEHSIFYKKIANTCYGLMASRNVESFLRNRLIAAAITDIGRQYVQFIGRYLSDKFSTRLQIIYGDTDSIFVGLMKSESYYALKLIDEHFDDTNYNRMKFILNTKTLEIEKQQNVNLNTNEYIKLRRLNESHMVIKGLPKNMSKSFKHTFASMLVNTTIVLENSHVKQSLYALTNDCGVEHASESDVSEALNDVNTKLVMLMGLIIFHFISCNDINKFISYKSVDAAKFKNHVETKNLLFDEKFFNLCNGKRSHHVFPMLNTSNEHVVVDCDYLIANVHRKQFLFDIFSMYTTARNKNAIHRESLLNKLVDVIEKNQQKHYAVKLFDETLSLSKQCISEHL